MIKLGELSGPEHSRGERFPQSSRFLSAMNSEVKVATLLIMAYSGKPFRQGKIYEQLLSLQGKQKPGVRRKKEEENTEGWDIAKTMAFQACKTSFLPKGLVVEGNEGGVTTYQINPQEQQRVLSLATRLYEFSRDHNVSLFDLVGTTPDIRLGIFEALLNNESLVSLNQAFLVKELGVPAGAISQQTQALARKGLISYEAITANAEFVTYTKTEATPTGDALTQWGEGNFHRVLCEVLNNADHPLRTQEVWEQLRIIHGIRRSFASMAADINTGMRELADRGLVARGEFTKNVRSQISVTEDQYALLKDFMKIIHDFESVNNSTIDSTAEAQHAQALLSDRQTALRLFHKAWEASYQTQLPGVASRQNKIIAYIYAHPNSSLATIAREMNVSSTTVLTYVSEGLERGMVQRQRFGTEDRYTPLPIEDQVEMIQKQGGVVLAYNEHGQKKARILAFGSNQVNAFLKKLPMEIKITFSSNKQQITSWRGKVRGIEGSAQLFMIKPKTEGQKGVLDSRLSDQLTQVVRLACEEEISRLANLSQ